MIPGPPSKYGAMGVYAHLIDFFRKPIDTMRHYQQKFGDISGVLAPIPEGDSGFVFAFGADYNRAVFNNPKLYHSSAMLDIKDDSVRRLGNGLTFMNGAEHHTKRKLIMPAFHKKYIAYYRDDMTNITHKMIANWQRGDIVDINQFFHEMTAQIAIKTLFGIDSTNEGREMSHLIAQWMTQATSPALRIFPFDLPFSPVRRMRKISHNLEQYMYDLIARKRATLSTDTDILATLMQTVDEDGNYLSNDDLIGQVNVLFLAGHETSANALIWTLFLLSQNPKILGDVMDELSGVLGGDAPTLEQLGQLSFLEDVINESMRILPPVVWIQRLIHEPVQLQDHSLGAGSTVILSHFMTHQNPDIYPDPMAFNPYRWGGKRPDAYKYMAFGAGPRMCIGKEFAMMEMKIVLAIILQRFQLELMPQTQLNRHVTVTLSPASSVPMRIKCHDEKLQVNTPTGNIHDLVQLGQ